MSNQDNAPKPAEKQNQLSLFEIIESHTADDRYSNTIELYDALPKYNWAKQREFHDLKDAQIVRHCTLKGQTYRVAIKPAIIEKDGVNTLIYPGQREEFVEDALRKFAVAGQSTLLNDQAGVVFTLYQLQQELMRTGHTYNLNEIKESIQVCRGATLECSTNDGETLVSSSFFPVIGLTTLRDYKNKGGDAKCFVTFNPLVTKSIFALSFRKYNYSLGMRINSPLARFFYKRMSHYWTQASTSMPYTPSLVSFLSQSPRGLSDRMAENVRAMKNALDVLIENKVVSGYDTEVIKNGRAIVDVRYTIRPHENFINLMMSANKDKNALLAKVELRAMKNSVRRKSPTAD